MANGTNWKNERNGTNEKRNGTNETNVKHCVYKFHTSAVNPTTTIITAVHSSTTNNLLK